MNVGFVAVIVGASGTSPLRISLRRASERVTASKCLMALCGGDGMEPTYPNVPTTYSNNGQCAHGTKHGVCRENDNKRTFETGVRSERKPTVTDATGCVGTCFVSACGGSRAVSN